MPCATTPVVRSWEQGVVRFFTLVHAAAWEPNAEAHRSGRRHDGDLASGCGTRRVLRRLELSHLMVRPDGGAATRPTTSAHGKSSQGPLVHWGAQQVHEPERASGAQVDTPLAAGGPVW